MQMDKFVIARLLLASIFSHNFRSESFTSTCINQYRDMATHHKLMRCFLELFGSTSIIGIIQYHSRRSFCYSGWWVDVRGCCGKFRWRVCLPCNHIKRLSMSFVLQLFLARIFKSKRCVSYYGCVGSLQQTSNPPQVSLLLAPRNRVT